MLTPQGSRALGLPEQRTFQDHDMVGSNGLAVRSISQERGLDIAGRRELARLMGSPPYTTKKTKGSTVGHWLPTGETTALKCLRPLPIGLSLGSALRAQPQYGYFGNTPRLFFLTSFPHLNYGGHTVRGWCSRLELGKPQHQLGPNVFQLSG